ncbi:hypothetical protein CLU83_0217 [Flavobacterium sp. 1]|nr:hypothetical protein CLU83_0217 [Flavobacterium sp. 1]
MILLKVLVLMLNVITLGFGFFTPRRKDVKFKSLFCVFPFLNISKKAKYLLLAPIAVKILVSRGSAHKIETESGTILPENA